MEQTRLPFTEDEIYQLLDSAVISAGGPKEVGSHLKPDIDPEEAGKWVNRCTNPKHKDSYAAAHYIRTLIGARARGNHTAINDLLAFIGYVPNATPVSAEAKEAAIMEMVLDNQRKINEAFEKLADVRRREKGEW